jgi:membrane associated rhomboid family serine protease
MLGDRDYMKADNNRTRRSGRSAGRELQSAVFPLIIVNVIIFFADSVTRTGGHEPLNAILAMNTPRMMNGEVWRFFTCMFAHDGMTHLIFNMYGLWLFGSIVERQVGVPRFFRLYFISGCLGTLLWSVANPQGWVLGASGAVLGLVAAAGFLQPEHTIRLLIPPVDISLKNLAIIYAVIDIILHFRGGTNIAHLAHLGGMLGGFLYLRQYLGKGRVKGRTASGSILELLPSKRKPQGYKRQDRSADVDEADIDRILEKIGREGEGSLTKAEKQALDRASEKMRGKE